MAEVILSAFVQGLLKKSASHILHQCGKMWGSNVDKEIKKLESTLSAIQAVLQDAEEKQVKNEALKNWLEKLKDAAYDADDVLEEFNYEVLRQRGENQAHTMRKVQDFFSFHNPIMFRSRMINKLKKVVERLDNIAAEKSKFHLTETGMVDRQLLISERPQTHSFVNESNIFGREEDKMKIVELLISRAGRSDISVLPIVGIGGLGKTTLAQLVYNEETVAEHFKQRIWVCVSEDFDIKNIVKTIIQSATQIECKVSDMDSLQRELRKVLGGKRFLLVLDDIWNERAQEWDGLMDLLTTGAEGSCIIVTTRSEIVSSVVGTLGAYRLENLSEDECWSLFQRKAFMEGGAEKHLYLIDIGKAIVKKCGGLPLAAKMLGSLMRTKREEWEWRSVMESEIWELKDDEILPSLRLSYNHLSSHVKQCFAYCAIFPKDYVIHKNMLIQLWMANGFIPFDPKKDMELTGHEIFNELASRSFFQDIEEYQVGIMNTISEQTCKMHDLIHDLAQSIMGNEFYLLDKPGSISNTRLRHLPITMNDPKLSTTEKVHAFKTVRTLLLLRDRSPFLRRDFDVSHINWAENNLRVLGLHAARMNELPISKLHLKYLRYLDLSRTDITTLPEAISSLLNLQTLNLSSCVQLHQLPKGLRKLSSLRHLYLHGCTNLTSMPKGIGQLRFLRTLTAYPVGNEIGSGSIKELEDLCIRGSLDLHGLKNVRSVAEAEASNLGSKQDLQYLRLNWRSELYDEIMDGNAEKILEALQPPQGLKSFRIGNYPGKRFPAWLMGESMLRYSNLVEIDLYCCERCEHLPQLGRLPCLENLSISSLASVKHIGGDDFYGNAGRGDQYDVVFPSLRIFWLLDMDEVEEWLGVEGRPSFPKLEMLTIESCPKLANFLEDSLQRLTTLKQLTLSYCEGMTALPKFPESLLNVSIRYCHNISSLPEGLGRLTALMKLEIVDLPKLSFLPKEMEGLEALKELPIVDCPNLISLPPRLQQAFLSGLRSRNLRYLSVRIP